jgi:plastocyanin
MRRIPLSGVVVALAAALIVAAVVVVVGPGSEPAKASHGNFSVHVHDDYFHPTGGFVVGPGHATAKALCEQGQPDQSCTSVIHVAPGDSITWISPAPLAANIHTVTECTNGNFNVCGPLVDPNNPIGDSGNRNPPNPGPSGWPYGPVSFTNPGFYYYRCDVHPTVMRGVVEVIANNAPPQPGVGGVAGLIDDPQSGNVRVASEAGTDDSFTIALIVAVGAIALLSVVGVSYVWVRAGRKE